MMNRWRYWFCRLGFHTFDEWQRTYEQSPAFQFKTCRHCKLAGTRYAG